MASNRAFGRLQQALAQLFRAFRCFAVLLQRRRDFFACPRRHDGAAALSEGLEPSNYARALVCLAVLGLDGIIEYLTGDGTNEVVVPVLGLIFFYPAQSWIVE